MNIINYTLRSLAWSVLMWALIEAGFLVYSFAIWDWYPRDMPLIHLALFRFCIPSGFLFAWWVKES